MPPVCVLRRIRFDVDPDESLSVDLSAAVLDPESGLVYPSDLSAFYDNFAFDTGRLEVESATSDSNDRAMIHRKLSKLLLLPRLLDKLVCIASGGHRQTYRVGFHLFCTVYFVRL